MSVEDLQEDYERATALLAYVLMAVGGEVEIDTEQALSDGPSGGVMVLYDEERETHIVKLVDRKPEKSA